MHHHIDYMDYNCWEEREFGILLPDHWNGCHKMNPSEMDEI
jgi:hypothetical protein